MIRVHGSMEDLYRARFEGKLPDVRTDGGTATVRYRMSVRPTRGEIVLCGRIPWSIRAGMGMSHVVADLEDLELMDLEISGGPLVVRYGCVLVGSPGEYSVPIWWKGFTADRDESGRLVVRDGDCAIVAIEGESFEMGGGYVAEFRPQDKVEPREDQLRRVEEWLGYSIPERCLGSDVYGVWSVGET
jgi:hypothetical protein